MTRTAVVLLAAGRGERLGGGAKAFVEIDGRTMLARAAEAAAGAAAVDDLVVVAPEGLEAAAEAEASSSGGILLAVVSGGSTRQASVRRALLALPDDVDVVCCHDAARPFAPSGLFDRVLGALAGDADGVVPIVPVADTLKRIDRGSVAETVDRDGLGAAQTPQAFGRRALVDAHERAHRDRRAATDDSALLERAGYRVVTVMGDPANLKITTSEDLALARAIARGAR